MKSIWNISILYIEHLYYHLKYYLFILKKIILIVKKNDLKIFKNISLIKLKIYIYIFQITHQSIKLFTFLIFTIYYLKGA